MDTRPLAPGRTLGPAVASGAAGRWTGLGGLALAVLPLALAGLLILYPSLRLLVGSFEDGPPGEGGRLTFANYAAVLADGGLLMIALRTVAVAVGSTVLAVFSGFGLAWLVARTDLPGRRLVGTMALVPFLIPPSLSAVGWAMLGNPDTGLLNATASGRWLNVYSYGGVAFVMAQHTAAFVYLMMMPALRNSDPSLEDAARLSGASPWAAFRTVQLPLILPSLLPLTVLAFVRAVESFEIPVILGTPAGVVVLTNEIYSKLKLQSPPDYGSAVATACLMTGAMGLLLAAQARVTRRRSSVVLTGKSARPRRLRLGAWTAPCLALVAFYALVTSILPIGIIFLSSFFRSFGVLNLSRMTLSNYSAVLANETVWRAFGNTIGLMVVCSTLCVALGALTALAVVRCFSGARAGMEVVLAIPWAMPGLVFGLAMLWSYIGVPGFYGTLPALGLAYVTFGLPLAFRAVVGVLVQISSELEQASLVHGATRWQTWRYTTLPLIMPGLAAGWFVLATIFSRELAASVLLYGPGSEVASVVLLGFWEQGRGNYVGVVSVFLLAILVALHLFERILTERRSPAEARAVGSR